ncbi:MAG: hypothetical protein NT062_09125 [Proteobacteria bacterium]|nr:hypothetical protein [Pseudomonadota bacterium]
MKRPGPPTARNLLVRQHMRKAFVVAVGLLSGCVAATPPATMPSGPQFEPIEVAGTPGGEPDPGTGYVPDPEREGAPSSTAPAGCEDPATDPTDPTDPTAPTTTEGCETAPLDPMATASDAEIDAALDGFGTWFEDPEYGRVWRPDATAVGANFTPYETCGSWVWTDAGWTFACDWDWGWLPFHYGQWDWFDDSYWAWVPDDVWSPGWVDWRSGSDYVGWRPTQPIRDHRPGHGRPTGPTIRDHRHGPSRDVHWTFVPPGDLGKHNIRAHVSRDLAAALAGTHPGKPAIKGESPVRISVVMGSRFGGFGGFGGTIRDHRTPAPIVRAPDTVVRPSDVGRGGTYQPAWRPAYRPPALRAPDVRNPDVQIQRVVRPHQPDVRSPDVHPGRPQPIPRWNPPADRPQPPAMPIRTYDPPSRPSAPRSYDPPSHRDDAPSRSDPPSHGESPSHAHSDGNGRRR